MTHVNWEIVTAAGVTIRTFDQEDAARKWLFDRRAELPGAVVERVERSEVRTRVYAPRLRMAA